MRRAFVELFGCTCVVLLCFVALGCGGPECGEGTVERDGVCVATGPAADICGEGTVERDGVCVADTSGETVCGDGTMLVDGACIADASGCGDSTMEDPDTGECVPSPDACGSGTSYDQGTGMCVPNETISCGEGTEVNGDGECEPVLAEVCGPKTEPNEAGQCVVAPQSCASGELLDPNSGECIATDTLCGENTAFDADSETCVPTDAVCEPGTTFDADTRLCLPDSCQAGDVLVAGVCLGPAQAIAREADVQSTENDDPTLGGTANQLTVEPIGDAAVFTGTIEAPRDIDGDLNDDQDRDVFSFQATEGEWFTVSVQSLGLPSPAFVVEGPQGFVRTSGFGSSAARTIVIPRDGSYTITVWPEVVLQSDGEVGPSGEPGWDYVGSLSRATAPAPTATDITTTQLAGDFVQLSDNLFEVQSTAPAEIVDLSIDTVGDDVDGIVQVWGGPNDFVGAYEVQSGDEISLPTPRSGRMLLLVDWREMAGPNDSFAISGAFRPDVLNMGYVDPGDTVVEGPKTIPAYETRYYSVVVEPGTVIEWFHADPSDTSVTYELQDASGNVIKTAYRGSATVHPQFAYAYVEKGGILVVDARATSKLENYEFYVSSFRPIDLGNAGPGDTISGTVSATRDWFRASYVQVDLTAPVRGQLSVSTSPDEKLFFNVHNDQNEEVFPSRGGVMPTSEDVDFKWAGRYFLRVFTLSDQVTSYDVDLTFEAPPQYEYEPNDAIATASPYALSGPFMAGRMANYDPTSRDVIEFQLPAAPGTNEMLLLDARSVSGRGEWSCKLTDAQGRVITSNGQGTHTSSCTLFTDDVFASTPYFFHLEGSGEYTFRANVVPGVAESEVNDSQASADPVAFSGLLGNVPAYSWLGFQYAQDFFSFTVPTSRASDKVTVFRSELVSGPGSASIRYLELIGESQGSIDQVFADEPLEVWGLPAGDYYLRTHRTGSYERKPVYLRVFADEATPTCGNGIKELSEACDDGNAIPEDGCNDQCQIVTDVCGNGVVEQNEECDEGVGGNVFCTPTCTYASPSVSGGAATGATTPPGSPAGYPSVLTESTMISGCSTVDFVTIDADIEHPDSLRSTMAVLESPSGTLSVLVDRDVLPRVTRVTANFPFERPPESPLSVMHGEVGNGTWTLYLHTGSSLQDATLHSWSVNLYCS